MLTWREQTAFEVDLNDFQVVGNYSYQGEGWGFASMETIRNDKRVLRFNFQRPALFMDFTIGVFLDGVKQI